MSLARVLLILGFEASTFGLCAFVSHRLGFRAGYWRGVARGMHLTQEAAMHVLNGNVADEAEPEGPN
jgi:hypothetical protein